MLPKRIWWGLYTWASLGYVNRMALILREQGLVRPDENLLTGTGDFPGIRAFGGAHLAMGRESTVAEIGSLPSLNVLIKQIADDLESLHRRFAPAVERIRSVWNQHFLTETKPSPANDFAHSLRDHFAAHGLSFTPHQIATFATALQTKGFVILSGISGTGKTKLAQHFADLLPLPATVQVTEVQDVVQFVVQPYMRKYGRMVIPKGFWPMLDVPPANEPREIAVTFGREKQQCKLVHSVYGDSDYLQLLLRGKARRWFLETFAEGDTIQLEPIQDENGDLVGFSLLPPSPGQPQVQPNHLFVSVRPDWRDSKSLLGYYNPLTETFDSTPFLRFLLRARTHYDEQGRDALPHFVILDEMNLARVEYYFADFLSVLESGRGDDGYSREAVALHSFQQAVEDAEGRPIPPSLPLPPNLYIVGTVNVDETTHAFSPKVLDRAFTLEFTDVDLAGYPLPPGDAAPLSEETRRALAEAFTRQGRFAVVDKRRVAEFVKAHPPYRTRLATLNELLRPHDLHFAYRVFDEIIAFLDNAKSAPWFDGFAGLDDAFDTAVLM
ncbi:MAG TPA: hypothetical protein ENJ31_00770 [Anaerolineae bacterium]|nr:hypothetical protein [Anaerolineae bacterium]